jgi:ketosteroid isomerase-like protein
MVRSFIVLIIIVCTPLFLISPVCSAQDHSRPETDILNVLTRQQQAWNQGNIGGYMEGYWKSDSLLFTSQGKIQRGYTATLEKYKKSYSTKSLMGTLAFSDLDISVLSQDAAWVFGRWALAREKDHPHGVFTLIFRKFPDGWKIIHDHTSSE